MARRAMVRGLDAFRRFGRSLAPTLLLSVVPLVAHAQVGSARYSSIVVDNATGRVVEAVNADAPRYPASLTKLMTLYMAFEALRDHRVSLVQVVPVSAHAAAMEPSKLGLVPGTYFTVSDAILAIVTKSANDAACALGELLGGDEDRFAQMMTLRARGLGMTGTTFRNASGLPDMQQTTTARDLALLAHHLIVDFPNNYHYFSEPVFYFHGRDIPNHDRMLRAYEGADGLKTGYTIASGFNLVTSALRGDVRLVGVVMGARNSGERDLHMASLLDDGFTQLGVPVTPHVTSRFHIPSLIASADASTLSAYHGGRPIAHFAAFRRDKHGRKLRASSGQIMLAAATHAATTRSARAGTPAIRPMLAMARGHMLITSSRHAMAAKGVATCHVKAHRHGCTFATRDARGT